MATQNIDNTLQVEITNPFKKVGEQFVGIVLATYVNEFGVAKTIKLYPIGDGSKLSFPNNVFKQTGQVVVSLQDNGTGDPVKVTLNVTNYTTTSTSTACGHTSGCGCSSTSNTTTESTHVINNITKDVSEISREVNHFNESIEQINCKISDTLKKVNDELDNTTQKIRLDADTKWANLENDIKTIQYIKDELPSYRSIRDEVADYKLGVKSLTDELVAKQDLMNKTALDAKQIASDAFAKITDLTVSDAKLSILNNNIDAMRKDLTDKKTELDCAMTDLAQSFADTSILANGFDARLKTAESNGAKVSELSREFNKYKTDMKIKEESLKNKLDGLDYSQVISELQQGISKNEECCKLGQEQLKTLKDRVCALESQNKELNKTINSWQPIMTKLLAGGFDQIPQDKLNIHIAHIQAGN